MKTHGTSNYGNVPVVKVIGALDFDLKVASLHIQLMGRLPLDYPSTWRLFARFWLDRVALPFGGWKEILNGLNVPVYGIPTFYVPIVKQYYRFQCGVTSRPSYRDEADAQVLWGNPGIVDRTGKPLGVLILARAGISIVGQLRTRTGFVDTDTLKRRFPLAWRGGSLVHVIVSIHAAVPRRLL